MLARPLLSSQRSEEKSWFEKVLARTTRKQQIAAIVVLAGVSALFLSSIIFLISRATTRLGYASSNAILSVDKMTYTHDNAPYFNESVPAYRARLTEQFRHVRKGTIFVSIASYRDNACVLTLREMFDKAVSPKRVFVGLVDQTKLAAEDSDDVPCESMLTGEERQRVRLVRIPSNMARGPTHARYMASKLWDGEQYFMQIDAHSHFMVGWDDQLISNLRQLPNPSRSAITHYPPGREDELGKPDVTWICVANDHEQAPAGLFTQGQDVCRQANMSPGIALSAAGERTTCLSPFMGGGFFAAESHVLYDAPFDRYLPYIFHGEEVLIAARIWTSGWDMYTPIVNIVSHVYGGRTKNVHVESQNWVPICRASEARARHILNSRIDDEVDFDRSEIEHLGVGTVRPLQDYMKFAGLELMKYKNFTSRCRQRWEPRAGWVDQDTPVVDMRLGDSLPFDG
ncbi:Glycosyltransferase 2-like domain-containing protein [Plasmodiophora brassicae]